LLFKSKKMTQKAKNITGWVLSILLALVFAASASMKLMGGEEAAKGAAAIGLSAGAMKLIGIVEIVSIFLFLVPRTAILGTLLLAAYLGGAIVTHLEHGQSIMAPVIIQGLVWITAFIRFPELSRRIVGKATV
jgi:uncharacterized membrane protein YphA (DoxX/SURF4 family)